ncbi:MAG: hypothetical protein H6747_03070 [Deltaproteobacteria bacterium]|nr:hypothetical protein [Deltaproteobacteria bacterium]
MRDAAPAIVDRRLLALTTMASLALLGTMRAASAAPAPVRRLSLECGKQHHAGARTLATFPFEHVGGYPPPRVALICRDANGRANGPALWIRRRVSVASRTLLRMNVLFPSQVEWTGQMRDNRRVGIWRQLSSVGRILQTLDFGDGRGARSFRSLDEDGVVRVEGALRDDQRDGTWRYLDAEGNVRVEAEFRADKLAGTVRELRPDGGPSRVRRYLDGNLHGLETTWWPSGGKHQERDWRAGARDGVSCSWNVHGELLGCNELEGGSGMWREWYDHGAISAEGAMVRGRRDGTWRLYHPNGALRAEGPYREGRQIAGEWQYYDPNGEKRTGRAQAVLSNTVLLGRLRAAGGTVRAGGLTGVGRGGGGAGGGAGAGGGIGGLGLGGRSLRGQAGRRAARITFHPTELRPSAADLAQLEKAILACPAPTRGGQPVLGVSTFVALEVGTNGHFSRVVHQTPSTHPAWKRCVEQAVRQTPTPGKPGQQGRLALIVTRP